MYWIFSSRVSTTLVPVSGALSVESYQRRWASARISILPGLLRILVVERVLDAAQSFFVNVHVSENVRGEFPLGIKTAAFPLEINPAQIHGGDAFRFLGRKFARDPRERMRSRQTRGNFFGRNLQHFADAGARPYSDRRSPTEPRKQESTGTLMASGFRLRSKISARLRADFDNQPLLVLRA